MKQIQKSRLETKYPEIYEALGIKAVKRDKRSPVALEFTKDEIAELYVLAQSYGQDINAFLEDTTLTLAWGMHYGAGEYPRNGWRELYRPRNRGNSRRSSRLRRASEKRAFKKELAEYGYM